MEYSFRGESELSISTRRSAEAGGRPAPVRGSSGVVPKFGVGHGVRRRLGPSRRPGRVSFGGLRRSHARLGTGSLWTWHRNDPAGQSEVQRHGGLPAAVLPYISKRAQL